VVHEPPPLSERAADVPSQLARVVDRCLARDPRRRWRDAGVLRRALVRSIRRRWWQR